jgi:hypothetical protein
MNQYMLSIVYPAGAQPPSPDALQVIMRNVGALRDEMREAGAWVFSAGLQPASTATMVDASRGAVTMTDGPYAETKEQIGGICIIAARDLDEALKWGEKLSRAVTVPVEVRPLQYAQRADG